MKTITIDGKEWQLVPCEPTLEMVSVGERSGAYGCFSEENCYHAMLSAATEAPVQDAKDDALKLAREALAEVKDLIAETGGVYGLHLNGNLSPWGEIAKGGRFERLTSLPEAIAAIDKAMKEN